MKTLFGILCLLVIGNINGAETTNIKQETTEAPQPTPTPIPIPENYDLSFQLTNNKTVCALFKFQAEIKISELNQTILLNNKTTLDKSSFCNESETSLALNINGEKNGSLNLKLNHHDSKYELSFVNLTLLDKKNYQSKQIVFSVDDTKSFHCLANTQITLKTSDEKESALLNLKNLKLDAFRNSTDTSFRKESICAADITPNDFVPLAVGCSLIALVFIVLIAYIVGRRRSRRLTYQSV